MAVVLNEYGGTVGVCIIFMHWNFTVSYSFLFHIGIRSCLKMSSRRKQTIKSSFVCNFLV